MSSFIINFSRRRPLLAALALAFALLFSADCALSHYVARTTTTSHFIDNKQSKFLHLALQPGPMDVIFVGSSFTKNHVSTELFRRRGYRIYNLGISGRFLSDFPSMASSALSASPRVVALLFSIDELYRAPRSDFLHGRDFLSALKSSGGFRDRLSAMGSYLLTLHTLHYYREPVYEFLKARMAWIATPGAGPNAQASEYSDQEALPLDCTPFKSARYAHMTVMTCTNGDGVQLGYLDASRAEIPPASPGESLDPVALSLLNGVLDDIAAKAKPIVVFTPRWGWRGDVPLRELQARIHAPLIDLSHATFEDRDWCDDSHFNAYGRTKFSNLLADRLGFILNK